MDLTPRSEWNQFMDSRPWQNREPAPDGDDFPATYVTWTNALEFCRRFTEHERQAGRLPERWEYTLPTEAQWERACRAGTTTRFSFGDAAAPVQDHAWVDENTSKRDEPYPHRVGQKRPNPWGLYDMHGNVSEWCQDWHAALPGGRDPVVTAASGIKVRRGGSFRESQCGSAARYVGHPEERRMEVGFRVACRFVEDK